MEGHIKIWDSDVESIWQSSFFRIFGKIPWLRPPKTELAYVFSWFVHMMVPGLQKTTCHSKVSVFKVSEKQVSKTNKFCDDMDPFFWCWRTFDVNLKESHPCLLHPIDLIFNLSDRGRAIENNNIQQLLHICSMCLNIYLHFSYKYGKCRHIFQSHGGIWLWHFPQKNGKSIIASNWSPAGKKLPNLHLPRVAWASGQSSTFPFSNESLRDSWDFDRWFLLLANFVCWELFFGSYMFLSSQCFELLLWTYAQGLSKSLPVVAHASICCHCTCKANRRVIIQLHSSPRNRFTTLCSPLNQNSGILLKSPTVSLLKATRKILAVSSLIRIKTYRIYTGRLGWCKCFCCPSTLFTHYAGTLLFSFFLLIPSRWSRTM